MNDSNCFLLGKLKVKTSQISKITISGPYKRNLIAKITRKIVESSLMEYWCDIEFDI